MSVGENTLVVEGETDKTFFTEILERLKLRVKIRVFKPSDKQAGIGNNKQGVLKLLPILLAQLPQDQISRLGLVVDADYSDSGNGFGNTLKMIEQVLNTASFSQRKRGPQQAGLVFGHPNGLRDLGVWIMPNNRTDGALEDFLKGCVSQDEASLFTHATKVVEKLPEPRKFKRSQLAKAELSTWLAWQRQPGRDIDQALKDDLFDVGCPGFAGLTAWLDEIFR